MALIASCSGLVIACSSDTTPGNGDAGDAGSNDTGGSASESGGSSNGGKAGSTTGSGGVTTGTGGATTGTGGATGTGGKTAGTGGKTTGTGGMDAGTDASMGETGGAGGIGAVVDGGNDGSAPDGGADAGPLAFGTGTALVTGTDYTGSEVAVVSRPSGTVMTNIVMPFTGDATVVVSGGKGFILERDKDRSTVDPLDQDGIPITQIHLTAEFPDGGFSQKDWPDPHDVVVVGKKAFVPLYNDNRVDVLALDTNTVASTIDLSAYLDAKDGDGSIELDRGFYDATSNTVFFLADRIDLLRYDTCLEFPALLIAVDATTEKVVGTPLSLQLQSPASVAFDAANRRVWVANSGCADGTTRKRSGVEKIDLVAKTSSIFYGPADGVNASGFIMLDGTHALLGAYDDSYVTAWRRLDLSTAALGAFVVPAIPDGAVADGPDAVLGVVFTTNQTSGAVSHALVRQRLSDGKQVVVAGDSLFELNTWKTTQGVAVYPQ
ncbi:MAG TPA: hypothetical protein VH062_35215 [Polyangiaceae bacterium]|nr:hypothetical protein [Polyangiaceae bacterium]